MKATGGRRPKHDHPADTRARSAPAISALRISSSGGAEQASAPEHSRAQTLVVISSREPKDSLADGGPISNFP